MSATNKINLPQEVQDLCGLLDAITSDDPDKIKEAINTQLGIDLSDINTDGMTLDAAVEAITAAVEERKSNPPKEKDVINFEIDVDENYFKAEDIVYFLDEPTTVAVYLLSVVKNGSPELFSILGAVQSSFMDKIHATPEGDGMKMIWKHSAEKLPKALSNISKKSEEHKVAVNNLIDMLQNFDYRVEQDFCKERDIVSYDPEKDEEW